jgi:ribosomal protein L16/L10AE
MGKGSGKLNAWQIQISGGVYVFEFKNLRLGRAVHFFKTIATKIPTPTVIKYQNTKVIKLAGSKKTNIKLGTFW